jgi:Ni/Co efflux regulator RcnB
MTKFSAALLATMILLAPTYAAAQTEAPEAVETPEAVAESAPTELTEAPEAEAPAATGGWDLAQYNGYTLNGRWYYGPPPADAQGAEFGFRTWRQGDRLGAYFLEAYEEITDYRGAGLRAPARGFAYLRDGRGDILYIIATTGVVQRVIAQ